MQAAPDFTRAEEVQKRYRDNFPRHVLGVTLHLQAQIMQSLVEQQGHPGLRINFEPYFSIIGESGARLTDIADRLGVSRQAANQSANQIENAGYIERLPDPDDGRAKILALTKQGRAVREQGAREAATIQQQMASMAGAAVLIEATQTLYKLTHTLGLMLSPDPGAGTPQQLLLAGFLPRLADYIRDRLMQLTIARGHPHLKLSFGQVLTAIGPGGGRIQQMARAQGVSKQAIGAVASELEALGYIQRVEDPRDARQVLLHFTAAGQALITDSVDSTEELWREFAALIDARALKRAASCMKTLYQSLHLENEIFENGAAVDIRMLSRQLKDQLGEQGARALGELLLSPNASES